MPDWPGVGRIDRQQIENRLRRRGGDVREEAVDPRPELVIGQDTAPQVGFDERRGDEIPAERFVRDRCIPIRREKAPGRLHRRRLQRVVSHDSSAIQHPTQPEGLGRALSNRWTGHQSVRNADADTRTSPSVTGLMARDPVKRPLTGRSNPKFAQARMCWASTGPRTSGAGRMERVST